MWPLGACLFGILTVQRWASAVPCSYHVKQIRVEKEKLVFCVWISRSEPESAQHLMTTEDPDVDGDPALLLSQEFGADLHQSCLGEWLQSVSSPAANRTLA